MQTHSSVIKPQKDHETHITLGAILVMFCTKPNSTSYRFITLFYFGCALCNVGSYVAVFSTLLCLCIHHENEFCREFILITAHYKGKLTHENRVGQILS